MGRSISTVTAALGERLPDENTWKMFISGLLGPHGWTTTRIFGADGSIKGSAKWYVDPMAARCAIRVTAALAGQSVELPFCRSERTASTVSHAGGVLRLYHDTTSSCWTLGAADVAKTIPGVAGDIVTFTLYLADALGAEA